MNTQWHSEVLPSVSTEILSNLYKTVPLFKFYLAGGTGLALLLGHRFSQDFDFFSMELFNEEILLQKLKGQRNLSDISKDEHTLHFILKGIKISLLGFPYPLLFPLKEFELNSGASINVADERDIACMKISAISGRGTKRDFIDLYVASRIFNLSDLVKLFLKKFSLTPYNNVHILKSLTYFADAEAEPMPDMLIPLSWDDVKKFFTSEIPQLI